MSIKRKLLALFVAIGLIPICVIAAITFLHYRKTLQELRAAQLEDIASLKAGQIEKHFGYLIANIRQAQVFYNIRSNLPVLEEYKSDPSSPEYRTALSTLDSQLKTMQLVLNLSNILLMSESEVLYATDPGQPDLPEEMRRRIYEEGVKNVYVSDVFLAGLKEQRLQMIIAAPVADMKEKFIGVIVFDLDLAAIEKMIRDTTGLGSTGEILIGKKEGSQLLFLHPLKHDPGAPLRRDISAGTAVALPMQQAVSGNTGSGLSVDYSGRKVVAAWRYIPALGWGIVAKIEEKEAFAGIYSLGRYIILVAIGVFLAAAFAAFFIARSILKPVRELSQGAEAIGSGNLDRRIKIDSGDEIGELAEVFNRMADDLKKSMISRDELSRELEERRALEAELRLRSSALQAAANGVTITDKNGVILWANEAMSRLTGYSAVELIGKDPRIFKSGLHDNDFYRSLWKTVLEGNTWRGEIVNRRRDGTFYDEELSITAIRDGEGRITHFIAIKQDITERKELERKLRQSNEDLEQFAYVISHDLQQPINSMVMCAEIAKAEVKELAGASEAIEWLETIQDTGKRMAALMRSLLDYARINSAKPALRPVHIGDIVVQVEKDLQSQIQETQAVITKNVLHESVLAEEHQLRQLLQNLIGNALKYHKPGKPPEIRIESRSHSGRCIVSVKDDGIGFDPKFREKIFNMFERIHQQENVSGAGIGLAICRQIVKRQGGRIWAEGEPDRGSTFYFTLASSDGHGA